MLLISGGYDFFWGTLEKVSDAATFVRALGGVGLVAEATSPVRGVAWLGVWATPSRSRIVDSNEDG